MKITIKITKTNLVILLKTTTLYNIVKQNIKIIFTMVLFHLMICKHKIEKNNNYRTKLLIMKNTHTSCNLNFKKYKIKLPQPKIY